VAPQTAAFKIVTGPVNLMVRIDGQPVQAPVVVNSVVGMRRTLEAISPQVWKGRTYFFNSWTDGALAARTIVTQPGRVSYRVRFNSQ
jgi:hypothetical protein